MGIYCLCSTFAVSVYRSPSFGAPLISQLVFGEYGEILLTKGNWLLIKCLHDHYTGWIHQDQILMADSIQPNHFLNFDLFYTVVDSQGLFLIPFGGKLPKFDGFMFELGKKKHTFSGNFIKPNQLQHKESALRKVINKLINTPYLKGGRTPAGMDAPALVQLVFSFFGISLFRTVEKQLKQGILVNFFETACLGDVFYFENSNGNVVHTGIYLGNNEILHSWGRVRVSKVDAFGLFDDSKKYNFNLRIIKRFTSFDAEKIIEPLRATDTKQMRLF